MPFAPRAAPDERSLVASSRTTSRTSRSSARKRSSDLRPPVARRAKWSDLDVRAVDTGRLLAADAVQKVGNGHPGTAMSLSPAAYLLYQNVMRHDPSDPTWLGRDRFVLSCGHSSLTQYVQLYLSGGATNPFVTLYLLQVVIGAVLLFAAAFAPSSIAIWFVVAPASASRRAQAFRRP